MATQPAGNTVAGLTNTLGSLFGQAQALGVTIPGAAAGGGATTAATTTPAAGTGTTATPGTQGAQARQIPATGKPEIRLLDGKTAYFNAQGQEITAFQYTESHQFKINLDYREGIATGLANLSRIFGARQERVRLLSNALANDANTTGSFNPVDLQKMSLETTTTQQLSEMQKKIFDSMRDSIQAWLR